MSKVLYDRKNKVAFTWCALLADSPHYVTISHDDYIRIVRKMTTIEEVLGEKPKTDAVTSVQKEDAENPDVSVSMKFGPQPTEKVHRIMDDFKARNPHLVDEIAKLPNDGLSEYARRHGITRINFDPPENCSDEELVDFYAAVRERMIRRVQTNEHNRTLALCRAKDKAEHMRRNEEREQAHREEKRRRKEMRNGGDHDIRKD